MFSLLSPYKWILWIAFAGALVGGYAYWEHHIRADERAKVVAEYNGKIAVQKVEAAKVLAQAIAETDAAKDKLRELTVNLEKDRENKQAQNVADLRARRAGPRLQFTTPATGSGACSATAQGDPAKPTSDPGPTVVQLPEPLNGNLLEYSADAQSLAIDYATLYTYVNNPALVCELRESK